MFINAVSITLVSCYTFCYMQDEDNRRELNTNYVNCYSYELSSLAVEATL